MRFFLALLLLGIFTVPRVAAQDTLPRFSAVIKANGKVLISWKNNYSVVNQISIQRSTDSLKSFTTLLTVPDPSIPENGFVDSKTQGKKYYYRVFILFGNSRYYFTRSRRPDVETAGPTTAIVPVKTTEKPDKPPAKPVENTVATNPPVNEPVKPVIRPVEKPVVTKPESKPVVKNPPAKEPVKAIEKPVAKPVENPVDNPVVTNPPVGTPPVAKPPLAKPPAPKPEPEEITLQKVENQRIVYMEDDFSRKNPYIRLPSKIKTAATIQVEKTIYVKRRDTLIGKISGYALKRFSDSLVARTKDTLQFVNADTVMIRPYIQVAGEKEIYRISLFVFTAKDGNVTIAMADYAKKKYTVKFFEDDNEPVFEVKDIRDTTLTVDRASFGHAGWFRFEIFDGDKLVEKNKLLIKRDF